MSMRKLCAPIDESILSALTMGASVKFAFGGNVCHVFSKDTGINLEA